MTDFDPVVSDEEGYCTCTQAERMETGWGFRRANWSPADAPVWIRVHFGCDRPLYGMGQLVTSPHGYPSRRHPSVEVIFPH